ncbi:MAG: hypothetical protein ACO213_11290 [Steroidobacteraceae bacterium]
MSQDKPIKLFISHVFTEEDDYHRFFEYVESVVNFFYLNFSKPDLAGAEASPAAIRQQMSGAELVVLLSGVYDRDPTWVYEQARHARTLKIPVIALEPFGTGATIHPKLAAFADATVPWNGREIVDAIRKHARNEDIARWDVIDFKLD